MTTGVVGVQDSLPSVLLTHTRHSGVEALFHWALLTAWPGGTIVSPWWTIREAPVGLSVQLARHPYTHAGEESDGGGVRGWASSLLIFTPFTLPLTSAPQQTLCPPLQG